jgi:hypothetical protein
MIPFLSLVACRQPFLESDNNFKNTLTVVSTPVVISERKQGGLAKADGSRYGGEAMVETCPEQQVYQTGTQDEGMSGRGNEEFEGQLLVAGKKGHVHAGLSCLDGYIGGQVIFLSLMIASPLL